MGYQQNNIVADQAQPQIDWTLHHLLHKAIADQESGRVPGWGGCTNQMFNAEVEEDGEWFIYDVIEGEFVAHGHSNATWGNDEDWFIAA